MALLLESSVTAQRGFFVVPTGYHSSFPGLTNLKIKTSDSVLTNVSFGFVFARSSLRLNNFLGIYNLHYSMRLINLERMMTFEFPF
jgi:hypothetical protein